MKQPIQGRVYYESDNGCKWFVVVPVLCVALLLSFIMAFVLNIALALGWYLIFFAPIIAMLPVLGLIVLMNRAGKNRNRILGGVAGLICGLILYLGYYWIGMVIETEGGSRSLRALPAYINQRIHTDTSEEVGRPSSRGKRTDVFGNYMFFTGEFLMVTVGLLAVGFYTAGLAWCPQCRKWKKQTVLRFVQGSGPKVIDAISSGKFGEAIAMSTVSDKKAPHTALAIDYCHEDGQQGWPPCPFFLSIKDMNSNMAGGSRTTQFDGALGKTLMSRMQMTHDEIIAAAGKFSGLEFIPKPTNFSASIEPATPERSEFATPAVDATITPALEPGVKPILCLKNKLIINLLGLLVILIAMAGIGMAIAGLIIYSEASGKSVGLKLLAGLMIVVGAVIGIWSAILIRANLTWLGNKYLKKLLTRKFESRTDALVRPDDPDAIFIEIVPYKNFSKSMLEEATDIGLLKIDMRRNELLIEGDIERYRIPATSIVSADMNVYQRQFGEHTIVRYFVMLKIQRDGGIWETTIAPRLGSGSIGHKKRAEQVGEFQAQIQKIMASAKPAEAEFKF